MAPVRRRFLDRASGQAIVAERVDADGPGAQAGIKAGDRVVAIDGPSDRRSGRVTAALPRRCLGESPLTLLQRGQYRWMPRPFWRPGERNSNDWLRLIALIYLAIGLYVLFRRWTAPGSTHFYIFCLVSFVFYAFQYSGQAERV